MFTPRGSVKLWVRGGWRTRRAKRVRDTDTFLATRAGFRANAGVARVGRAPGSWQPCRTPRSTTSWTESCKHGGRLAKGR